MIVTKRVTFESSHYLDNPTLSPEDCKAAFGNCSGFKNGKERVTHGHSYKMNISVTGVKDTSTGFIINFKDLKQIIESEILSVLDHNCLNDVIPEQFHPVTVENMIDYIVKKTDLLKRIRKVTSDRCYVCKIKIWETEDSFAEEILDVYGRVI